MTNTLRTDRVRILVFIKKRDDISSEEFHRYWLDEHSKVILRFLSGKKDHSVIKYEQLHVNRAEKARLEKFGIPTTDFDGAAMFEGESFEKIMQTFNDPDYDTLIRPDEEKFMNREEAVSLWLNMASIVDNDEDLAFAAQMGSGGSAYLKPPTKLRKDRARVILAFKAQEGVDLKKCWLQDHAEVVKATPLGGGIIKYEQLHLAAPIRGITLTKNETETETKTKIQLPDWTGVALIDAPTYDAFHDPKTTKMLQEDAARWQVPGTTTMFPVDVATIVDADLAPAYEASLLVSKL